MLGPAADLAAGIASPERSSPPKMPQGPGSRQRAARQGAQGPTPNVGHPHAPDGRQHPDTFVEPHRGHCEATHALASPSPASLAAALLEDVEPPELVDELEPHPELEDAPELDELLEDVEPPELVDEPLEDGRPPELVDELLEVAAPELDELELEAASVTGRLPPSSAGDSPSPSPI
jgi:hypothetical protein